MGLNGLRTEISMWISPALILGLSTRYPRFEFPYSWASTGSAIESLGSKAYVQLFLYPFFYPFVFSLGSPIIRDTMFHQCS